ncbi:MAG: hypothetical protein Kow0092_04160 [Deferrisomatales bacterium]
MTQRTTVWAVGFALLTSLWAAPAPAQECRRLFGYVRLQADPGCGILEAYPQEDPQGPVFLAALGVPNACFTVRVLGPTPGTGFAGLTSEPAVHALQGEAVALGTPVVLDEQGASGRADEPGTRRFFTARSVLDLPGGSVYTADAGVSGGDGAVEQLLVVDGTGAYEGAEGTLTVLGDATAGWTFLKGTVCVPEP